MTARLIPHPLLTLTIAVVWVALANELSVAHVLVGLVLGLVIPWFTSAYWPNRASIKKPVKIVEYLVIVLWDIIVSNIQVAYWILFRRGQSLRSQFVTVPLDVQTPEAITVLAGTITMTPGTVSADLAANGSAILVHCLETGDAAHVARHIKDRYERRLREIFE